MKVETPQAAAQRLAKTVIAKGFQQEALHTYCDPEGQALYWRIRLKHPHTHAKWIRPMRQNEQQQFMMGEPDFPHKKPLYGLSAILQNPQAVVWIVEGEWCADHLIQRGLIATTSGSAESAATADWMPLKNRSIVVWPDNDKAGIRYAQFVTAQLKDLNCSIQWVCVDDLQLPQKGDCVDWLNAHPEATQSDIEFLPMQSPVAEKHKTDNHQPIQKIENLNPFIVNEKGVFYSDDNEQRWICSRLIVQALARDNASENWGRLLELTDADGQVHRWAMPMEMLKGSGEELRGELLRLGLQIASGSKARHALIEYITTSQPDMRACCVSRTGWHDHVFVLPDHTIGDNHELVIYQTDNQARPYRQSGTLAQWQQQIAARCVGNSRLVLAVSCAFAALLLHPAGAESGGLHFVGESSTGKTTALRVAASVYGAPDYLQRWRATTNGLEALAALRSDTLLVLDELSQVDPREAGEAAYLLANGSGKARASKNGGVRHRYEWRLLFLSAGEIGLAQHIHDAGKKSKAGQTVRLVDIPADAGQGYGIFESLQGFSSSAELSKALVDATSQFYGTAAHTFLEKITQSNLYAGLNDAIQSHRRAFIEQCLPRASGGQVIRVCERFALIAAAGELATEYGITAWPLGEARRAAMRCFQDWLEQRGGIDNQERTAFLAQVQAFFEAHGASRFEEMGAANEQHIVNRVGFRQNTVIGQYEYFVLPEMFRREICQGYDPRWAAKLLVSVGMLQPSSEGKSQIPYRLPGEGLKKCYRFIHTESQC